MKLKSQKNFIDYEPLTVPDESHTPKYADPQTMVRNPPAEALRLSQHLSQQKSESSNVPTTSLIPKGSECEPSDIPRQ